MSDKFSFGENSCGIQVGVNNGSINYNLDKESIKELPFVDGAVFDSYQNQHDEECLPGTRTDILSQIDMWASAQAPCMFWLNGMAGTGKSTISRTVARSFSQKEILGASFFFKRGEADRGNALKLFPTVARQLAFSIPELHTYLQRAVVENPGIGGREIQEQFDKLLLQPLVCLAQSDLQRRAVVIVVDALDECDGDKSIRLVLQLLSNLRNISTLYLRVKVFLTSRPELPIRLGFLDIATSEITTEKHQDLILHEIPENVITHDISLFFHHRLSKIRRESFLFDDWPGETDFRRLVNLSIPLFIFAATICRLFEDPNWDPIDSLTEVLAHRYDSNLDQTYLPVLNRVLAGQSERQKNKLIQEFQQVIGPIVILESPLSVPSLSKLLDLPESLIQLRLKLLHSVLQIPPEADKDSPVRVFHLSFKDFLLDPETRDKTPLSIDKKEACCNLAMRCLLVCQNQLQKNICELPSEGTYRAEIDQATIDRHIPTELQYSCRYWVHHLLQCDLANLIDQSFSFLQRHFLHWVEVLSLLGRVSEVVGIINELQAEIPREKHRDMSDFLHDAKQFILKNLQIADDAPLQVYSAGLIFAPTESLIRQNFEADIPCWISRLPQVEESWSAEIQTLEGHSERVTSVAFSPDGLLLGSASDDGTVRLWDPATGALQQTIEHYSGGVGKVVFSPGGGLLASVSKNIIHLWDPKTGALQRTLKGHSGYVLVIKFSPNNHLLASTYFKNIIHIWDPATGALQQTLKHPSAHSLAFSPDSHLLATAASSENTVQLWDPITGMLRHTLRGHLLSVELVIFSPNGQLLASTSDDRTIRLWDPVTGTLQHLLKGHASAVCSVAFSPDSHLLAAAVPGLNSTVKLWDSTTGTLQHTLKGHSNSVCSLAFAPDGDLLASGSWDKTVRLWNPATGMLQQTLKGHVSLVGEIAFSPDGQLLASASSDRTIRLWNPTKGPLRQKLEVHSSTVQAVAFSSDGHLLASGSRDQTVRRWDPVTGALQQTLKGHSDTVSSAAFSPDGNLLASGSRDESVRLWKLATGALQQTLKHQSGGALRCDIRTVAFSPNGCILASGSRNSIIWLWDLATGTLQQSLKGHQGSVSSVAFSPDGRLLASGSYNMTVQLWNLATGALQQTLGVYKPVEHLEFTEDSLFLKSNLGLLGLQAGSDNCILIAPEMVHDIWIRGHSEQFTKRNWIELKGEKRLWLPTDFRPICFAIHGNLLALGHLSGRISFLSFDI